MKDEYLNHKDFIESLKNPTLDIYHKVYHKGKGRRNKPVKKKKEKYTLTQIGDALFALINRFDYVVKANNLKDLPKQKPIKK